MSDEEKKNKVVQPKATIVFHSGVRLLGYIRWGMDISEETLGGKGYCFKREGDGLDPVFTISFGSCETIRDVCDGVVGVFSNAFRNESKEFVERQPLFAKNMCIAVGDFEKTPDLECILASTPDADVKQMLQRCAKAGTKSYCVRRLNGGDSVRVVSSEP